MQNKPNRKLETGFNIKCENRSVIWLIRWDCVYIILNYNKWNIFTNGVYFTYAVWRNAALHRDPRIPIWCAMHFIFSIDTTHSIHIIIVIWFWWPFKWNKNKKNKIKIPMLLMVRLSDRQSLSSWVPFYVGLPNKYVKCFSFIVGSFIGLIKRNCWTEYKISWNHWSIDRALVLATISELMQMHHRTLESQIQCGVKL